MQETKDINNFFRNVLRPIIKECIQDEFSQLHAVKSDTREKEILMVAEAAELLSVSVSTIYSYTHRNLIPHYKKGKKLYFKRKDLEAWLESGRNITQDEFDLQANQLLTRKNLK